jgi:hypothetical protein
MLTENQVKKLEPLPFEPVFRYWVDKKTGKRIRKPVMVFAPEKNRYVQKQERPSYSTYDLMKWLKVKTRTSNKEKRVKRNVLKPGFMHRVQHIVFTDKNGKLSHKIITHRA